MSAPMKLFSTNILQTNLEIFPHLSRRILRFSCSNFQRDGVKKQTDGRHIHSTAWFQWCHRGQKYQICSGHLLNNTFCGLQTRHFIGKSVTLFKKESKILSDIQRNSQDESCAKKEKENIYTLPNLLTISRIILTPAIGYCVIQDSYSVALGLFAYAGLSDLLDGYIARNFKNQMSAFGTALDPLADKFLITVLTVTLTISNMLPAPLSVLIVGRDVLLVMTGFVIRYVSLPPPKTLKRYFDVTYPTAKLIPSKLSKWNTANQILLVMLTLAAPVFDFVDHPVLQGLWYLTAATTFGSGIDYIINWKSSVKYLKV